MRSNSYLTAVKICKTFQQGGFYMTLEKHMPCLLIKSQGQHCQNIPNLLQRSTFQMVSNLF